MSVETTNEAQGVRSLSDWLVTISESEQLADLDSNFHRALRDPARELLSQDGPLGPAEIGRIESSPRLSALSAAVHLRSLEVVKFWRPLLKSCLTGKSTAPLADLQSTIGLASALADRLSARPASPVRDEVLRLVTEAEERTKRWLPKVSVGETRSTSAARYRRGAFERTEDEDGNPIERPPPSPEEAMPPPESALRSTVGWLMTALAIAAIVVGAWSYSSQAPEPLSLSHYQAFLSEAVKKEIIGTELVLVVAEDWAGKSEGRRAAELQRLIGGGGLTEPYEAVRILDEQGSVLARLEPPGGPEWAAALAAKSGGSERPASPPSSGGMLEKPLRSDEIPFDE